MLYNQFVSRLRRKGDGLMTDWIRDLGIATIGAIIGAALIYFVQTGILFTQKSRAAAQTARAQEEKDWHTKDFLTRQTISNAYYSRF